MRAIGCDERPGGDPARRAPSQGRSNPVAVPAARAGTPRLAALLATLALGACVQASGPAANDPFGAPASVAEQRMAFALESVCIENRTRSAQLAAARRIGFPIEERNGAETTFLSPSTGTILVIGPVEDIGLMLEDGSLRRVGGPGCWVGSPSVGRDAANAIAGRVLAPRMVEGSRLTRGPIGAGEDSAGGLGFFFENLAVTVGEVGTIFTGPQGQPNPVSYPIIVVLHS